MNTFPKIPLRILVCIFLIFLFIFHISTTSILHRLNFYENAEIEPEDPYFRFSYFLENRFVYSASFGVFSLFPDYSTKTIPINKIVYTSENVSWYWLVSNNYIINGEVNTNPQFHVIQVESLGLPSGEYNFILEAYY